jgi:hypothetical protein
MKGKGNIVEEKEQVVLEGKRKKGKGKIVEREGKGKVR